VPDGDAPSTEAKTQVKNGGWIVSPLYDHLLFIWPPVMFMGLAGLLWFFDWQDLQLSFGGKAIWVWPTFALTFTMAHVVAVFWRSHGNGQIFKLHPIRFTVVPLSLIALFTFSETAFVVGLLFATWFDNYHSSMQTFGLGRIYDMRAGNDAHVGRRLDMMLALVVFMGPIIAGATFAMSLGDFARFGTVGFDSLVKFPGWALANQTRVFTIPILVGGLGFVAYYLYAYWRLAQRGYRVSKQKVLLWSALATTSILVWGFDTFGQAFLVMESFHSLQYFGIVWWSEKKNLQKVMHLEGRPLGRPIAFTVLIVSTVAFGLWTSVFQTVRFELVLFLVIELMHYWWDGFIWSVRKKQIA
jgi:hypothetical protein